MGTGAVITVEFLGGPLEGATIPQRPSHCAEGAVLTLPVFDKDGHTTEPLRHERYVVHWNGQACEAIHDGRIER